MDDSQGSNLLKTLCETMLNAPETAYTKGWGKSLYPLAEVSYWWRFAMLNSMHFQIYKYMSRFPQAFQILAVREAPKQRNLEKVINVAKK